MLKALVLASIVAVPNAIAATAVSRLTCKQAVAQVKKSHYIYKDTADGAVSYYVEYSTDKNANCPHRHFVWYEFVQTRDNPSCHVGYNCINKY